MAKSSTATDLTHVDPLKEINACAAKITDSILHLDQSNALLRSVESIVGTLGLQAFDAHGFTKILSSVFAEESLRRELKQSAGTGRQYVVTRIERTDMTGNSVAVLPTDIQAKIPVEIVTGLDRLELRFGIEPERGSLHAMFEPGNTL